MALDLNTKPWYVAVIIGVLLGAALFVVMHLYVFKDIQTTNERLQQNIDDLEREIEKGRAAKADLPRLEEDIRNYEIELDRLRRILPTRRETDNLLKRLVGPLGLGLDPCLLSFQILELASLGESLTLSSVAVAGCGKAQPVVAVARIVGRLRCRSVGRHFRKL